MADGMRLNPCHLHTAGTPQPIWLMEHVLALALLHDVGIPQPIWLLERLTLALLHDAGIPQPIMAVGTFNPCSTSRCGDSSAYMADGTRFNNPCLLHAAGTPQSIWLMECVLTLDIFML
jgi:hypothetical protein